MSAAAKAAAGAPRRGVRLRNRDPRGRHAARGVAALILGGVCCLGAVPAILFGMREIGMNVRNVTPDIRITVGLFGCSLLIIGVLTVVSGIRDLLHNAGRPDSTVEAWRWEYAWNPARITDGTGEELLKTIWSAFIFGLFLLPFHWVILRTPDIPIAFPIVFAIFDLAIIALFARAVHLGIRLLRFGRTHAACSAFPFFLGGTLAVELELPRDAAVNDEVKATLRCIEESYQRGSESTSTLVMEVYSATQMLRVTPASAGNRRARAEFQLPEGDFGTSLDASPPRYWELELASHKPGVDYLARLLMPVYGRS